MHQMKDATDWSGDTDKDKGDNKLSAPLKNKIMHDWAKTKDSQTTAEKGQDEEETRFRPKEFNVNEARGFSHWVVVSNMGWVGEFFNGDAI